ncbi:MAG: NAD(P)/FAD-dependent oxidoreductase [Bdellovibrio sp.]|nr:NAD(P)/FAD-dependent oxidoreductase [Bdellovibrio sp.]
MERINVAIIGGGVIGCAAAYELSRRGIQDIFVFEKLPYLGDAQSGRNSGVIHAGIYYRTDSLKARLCIEGNALMYDFCRQNDVPAERVGKLVVACTDEEVARLEKLFSQAKANSVPDLVLLETSEIKKYEPNVFAKKAMLVPSTGIVDAASYVKTLEKLANNKGATHLTNFEITNIKPQECEFLITGVHAGVTENFSAKNVINAAGLYSDRVAKMINPTWQVEIEPLRGEYYKFNRKKRAGIWLNQYNVYPVPTQMEIDHRQMEVVGIHLTPTFTESMAGVYSLSDLVTVGPEFVYVRDREDYSKGRKPKSYFHQFARRFFPQLEEADLQEDFTGIMANLKNHNDFIIQADQKYPNCIQTVGISSPGLTSSLAIAGMIASLID